MGGSQAEREQRATPLELFFDLVPAAPWALAICKVEAGLRSGQSARADLHPSLWDAVSNRIQRAGGAPVSAASVLWVQVQELTPGLVDAVRGSPGSASGLHRVALEAVPGRWELIELLYEPVLCDGGAAQPRTRVAGYPVSRIRASGRASHGVCRHRCGPGGHGPA